MQRELIGALGAVGAPQVRFLFGLPFALVFLASVGFAMGDAIPAPSPEVLGWATIGAGAQIVATALMHGAMRDRVVRPRPDRHDRSGLASLAVRRLHGRARLTVLVRRLRAHRRVARVRTLALAEVLFAQIVSLRLFREIPSRRERLGMALIVVAAAVLVSGLA
jgi:hypothetical protein